MNALTEKLEGLLEAQAMVLSSQHQESGQQASSQIRAEAQARMQQRLDGEEQRFQREAEHLCRQLLQGARLRQDAELDRVRWTLVQDVLSEVREHLEHLHQDGPRYRAALSRYLAEAAHAMPGRDLVAELTPRDADWLRADWTAFCEAAAPGRKVALVPMQAFASGGMRVSDAGNAMRIDNTFEGRLARLEYVLLANILRVLFPGDQT